MLSNGNFRSPSFQEFNNGDTKLETKVYKIVDRNAWEKAQVEGVFRGAAIDLTDGYIHFSAVHQVRETAKKHFAGQQNLVLVCLDAEKLGEALKWEKSRGGELFPHLYAELSTQDAESVVDLPWTEEGHVFPDDIPSGEIP